MDCHWGGWSSWESCNEGVKTKSRTKTVNEAHGGACNGQTSKTETCNINTYPRTIQYQSYTVLHSGLCKNVI